MTRIWMVFRDLVLTILIWALLIAATFATTHN